MPFGEIGGKFAELEWKNVPGEDGEQRYLRTSFYNAGRDSYTQPTAYNPDLFTNLTNFAPTVTGALRQRPGIRSWIPALPANFRFLDTINLYENASTGTRRIMGSCFFSAGPASRLLTWDESGTPQNTSVWTYTGTDPTTPRMITSRGYAFHLNQTAADLFKYNGNDTTGNGTSTWGIAAPTGAPTIGATASGNISIQFWRDYCYAYYNSTTGQYSDISPFARLTGPVSAQKQTVNGITVDSNSANTGTSQRVLLCTADGGSRTRLYLVTTLADNTTTTYDDNTAEATLTSTNPIYADLSGTGQRLGLLGNQPAPNGKFLIKHRGRVYIVGLDDKLHFSKSIEEVSTASGLEIGGRFEECFPTENVLDISTEVETITGIISDGLNLYIGTRRNIYRLVGDGPDNYEPIQVAIKEVGLVSDRSWKIIFRSGSPIGAMWLTPDYRVVFSDFNTYQDVSTPIRDILIPNPYYGSVSQATYIASKEFNCYALALAGTDLLVYDTLTGRWHTWAFNNGATQAASIFFWQNATSGAPEILFTDFVAAGVYSLDFGTLALGDLNVSNSVQTAVSKTATTGWLDFGSPEIRKALNGIDIVSDYGDTITATLYGAELASQMSHYGTPVTLATNAATVATPSADWRVQLAQLKTAYKWYKVTFTLSASVTHMDDNVINALSIEWLPLQTTL